MIYFLEGTLITVAITSNRIYLLSDGRATDSRTGESVDNHTKIHKINESTGLLVAGKFIPELRENVKQKLQNADDQSIETTVDFVREEFERVWGLFEQEFTEQQLSNARLFSFVVGYDCGDPKLFLVDIKEDTGLEVTERELFQNDTPVELATLSHGGNNTDNASDRLVNEIQNLIEQFGGFQFEETILKTAFDNVKNQISEINPAVGGNTYLGVIKPDDEFILK